MLWLALNGWFASSLLRAHRRARTFGDAHRSRLLIWILAYWVAMMVNASFDVYLEGPQGGIWFWALVGVGIVAMQEDQVSAGSSFPAIPSASRM